MAQKFESIDEYVKTLPESSQAVVNEIRQRVQKVAPDVMEAISYNMPAFKLRGQSLVHFAAWKDHIGFYPMPSETADIYQELSPYLSAKSSICFPFKNPIPYELIERFVHYRMEGIK